MKYPLRIRFWYTVHDWSERLYHWVWRSKLAPWHDANRTPRIGPTYRLIETIPATDAERAKGITEKRIYRSNS